MKLVEVFNHKTVFSIEVFPPKTEKGSLKLHQALSELKGIEPDFISVTLGAGGSTNRGGTVEVASEIQNHFDVPAVAHVPGLYRTKGDVDELLDELEEQGITNVLALRGDQIEGLKPVGDFKYASDLVSYIKQRGGFEIAGACYPETHQEADNSVNDIRNLKAKVDAGVDHLITQAFFDNQCFYEFREKTDLAGIDVPIEAGIMPCLNKKQVLNMAKMAGIPVPQKHLAMMEHYDGNVEATRDAGIAYAIDQIVDLVAQGVDGIHLYTMNNGDTAQRIWKATRSLFAASVR